jgi:hypothetical protein
MNLVRRIIRYIESFKIALTTLAIAIIYFLRIPHSVQSGDTGELVTSAFGLFVPHPPGYPLFIWLQFFFIHAFDFSSVFWRASLLNVFFAVGCIYCLGSLLKENKPIAIGSMLLLAFSRIFWKYSLLPDVFILNALIAAAILFLYFKDDGKVQRTLWIPFLFFLGLTNHLTLVFLFPIVDIILIRRNEKKLYLSILLGLIAFVSLYWSLVLMRPSELSSWGNVVDFEGLIHHILRTDYGTFKLVNSNESGSALVIWKIFSEEMLIAFYSLLIILIMLFLKFQKRHCFFTKKSILLVLILFLYPVVFFSLSNMEMTGFRSEIIERFFILFQIIFIFCAGYSVIKLSDGLTSGFKSAIGGLLIFCALISFVRNKDINNFGQNTIIEDYVLNLLNAAPTTPTVLLVHSDTRVFALRYAQVALGVRPDVKVVAPKMLFFPWHATKFVRDTGFNLDFKKTSKTKELEMEGDLILNNIDRFSFLTIFDFKNINAYHIKFLPLGRLLSVGRGASLPSDNEYYKKMRTFGKDISSPFGRYDISRDLWTDYCVFPVIVGNTYIQNGNTSKGREVLQDALKETPWCLPAAQSLCALSNSNLASNSQDCSREVEDISVKYYPYWIQ